MPLVSLGFSPTARQTEPDGQLTPLRKPLDPIELDRLPGREVTRRRIQDTAAPEFTLDATFPTPMHWLAEAQATPLKVVIGTKPVSYSTGRGRHEKG